MNDTVFAPATPPGGAIAIVRISGPETEDVLKGLFTGVPEHRKMVYGKLVYEGKTIDQALACLYRAPESYTGEDMAEIFIHGSVAVLSKTLEALGSSSRPAKPGEFTERAYLNGKLSLTEAEAVMDIINAGSERSARTALDQLEGSVGREAGRIEAELIDLLAGVEASLDFPEELEEDMFAGLHIKAALISKELHGLIDGGLRGRYLREGATVAILGAPNAGKSSLFNALVGRERAIVTSSPGTTRDALEESATVAGAPVRYIDTAGLRETSDEAERLGVLRARDAERKADILILAFDAAKPLDSDDTELVRDTEGRARIAVLCKGDLTPYGEYPALKGVDTVTVSSKTGEGLDGLKQRLAAYLTPEGETALVTNSRHIEAFMRAAEELDSLDGADYADCVAAKLRAALAAIGEVTGRDVGEDVIDSIFSKFCVGK